MLFLSSLWSTSYLEQDAEGSEPSKSALPPSLVADGRTFQFAQDHLSSNEATSPATSVGSPGSINSEASHVSKNRKHVVDTTSAPVKPIRHRGLGRERS